MINEGYAWEYDGGTKKKDFDSLLAKRAKSWYNISRRQTLVLRKIKNEILTLNSWNANPNIRGT
jgi:pyruvoyl-dependent arginine decarboxylase (PvlArgDC)